MMPYIIYVLKVECPPPRIHRSDIKLQIVNTSHLALAYNHVYKSQVYEGYSEQNQVISYTHYNREIPTETHETCIKPYNKLMLYNKNTRCNMAYSSKYDNGS